MKRVIVIGSPGSGKSVFSLRLHEATQLPLYHLDCLYWNEDRTTVEREVFLKRLSNILEQEKWIIDGNFESSMEERMKHCDTIVFLDIPLDICLDGIVSRVGKRHVDLPWVEEEIDVEFVDYVKSHYEDNRLKIKNLMEKYSEKKQIVFLSREEAGFFLTQLKNQKSAAEKCGKIELKSEG